MPAPMGTIKPVSQLLHWSTVNHTAGNVHLISAKYRVFLYHLYVGCPTAGARVDLFSRFSGAGAGNPRTRWVGPQGIGGLQLYETFGDDPLEFDGLSLTFVTAATSECCIAVRLGGPDAHFMMSPTEVFEVDGES